MSHHLEALANPPFNIGQRVRIIEDGPDGDVCRVMGVQYEHRMVPGGGWSFWVVEEHGIDTGWGGCDHLSSDQLEKVY